MEIDDAAVSLAASLIGAVVGSVVALRGASHAAHKLAKSNDQEQRRAEKAALRAAVLELDVAARIAEEKSTTDLPTQMLVTVLPVVHHMGPEQQKKVIAYSQSVLRYNGRVQRIVAYGAAKRIRGEDPGAEKPTDHAKAVGAAAPDAREALEDHMGSPRYPRDGSVEYPAHENPLPTRWVRWLGGDRR